MTKDIFIILMFFTINMFGQDTTVTWIKNIDTLDFEMFFNKRNIPKDFRKYSDLRLRKIANPGRKYNSGCIGSPRTPFMRLNWIAKDKRNHYVISISHGGYASGTNYFYFDTENKKMNINRIYFKNGSNDLSFGMTTMKIKNREFEFGEYIDPKED